MSSLAQVQPSLPEIFNEKGYAVLRGLFTEDEVAQWQQESDRLLGLSDIIQEENLRVGFRTRSDGERYVEKIDPLVDISPVFQALAKDERILSALRAIYNDEPVLFKDKLIFKMPGVTGYTMHQDASWWQGFPIESLISVMVAIDGADRENGGLELFWGYHDRFLSTPGELRNLNAEETALIDEARGELVETNPGDIILFHSLAPHRSGQNLSNRWRRQLYLTYNAAEHGDLYAAHYKHYHEYVQRGWSEEQKSKATFR